MSSEAIAQAEALRRLATQEGEELLAEAARLPQDRLTRLTRLRKQTTVEVAAAAVELLELRQRGRAKFTDADHMFFTPEGLEQATGDAIAGYRALRFPAEVPILDACSGIGGDVRWLARRGPVIAADLNPAAALCTHINASLPVRSQDVSAEQLPVSAGSGVIASVSPAAVHPPPAVHSVHTLCADVTALPLLRLQEAGVQAAFFDPSRRADHRHGGRRRLRAGEDYLPPLAWLETLRAHFPMVAVKVSPAIDDESLRSPGVRVEFLSDRGECKEAVLWFGPLADHLVLPENIPSGEPYFATVLRKNAPPATLAPFACPPLALSAPRAWLYEPDPAVIRAHLVPQAAALLDAALLEPQIAYLTADRLADTPFATPYRILDALPYNSKQIQSRLRVLGGQITAVKKRGVPFEPADVQKKLTPAGSYPLILILTRIAGKPVAFLCERGG